MKRKLEQTSQETITTYTNNDCVLFRFLGYYDWGFLSFGWPVDIGFHTHASHGSGWTFLGIESYWVKLFFVSTIQGRYYKSFPSNLRNCHPSINIGTLAEENCFPCCYATAYTEVPSNPNKFLAVQDKPRYLFSQYQPLLQKSSRWVLNAVAIPFNWSLWSTQRGPIEGL